MKLPGEGEIACGAMIDVIVGDAADDGIAIGQPGESGEMFADARADGGGGGGAKFAANFLRGVGLGIEGIELADAAAGEDEQDGARPLVCSFLPSISFRRCPSVGSCEEILRPAEVRPLAAD
jgi:hypothetical protein